MNLVVYGNMVLKGDSNLAVLHVESPNYDPEVDAEKIETFLRETLPAATFAELVEIMKTLEPPPF